MIVKIYNKIKLKLRKKNKIQKMNNRKINKSIIITRTMIFLN